MNVHQMSPPSMYSTLTMLFLNLPCQEDTSDGRTPTAKDSYRADTRYDDVFAVMVISSDTTIFGVVDVNRVVPTIPCLRVGLCPPVTM